MRQLHYENLKVHRILVPNHEVLIWAVKISKTRSDHIKIPKN